MNHHVKGFIEGAADIHKRAASEKEFKTQIRVLFEMAYGQGATDAREEDQRKADQQQKEGQARLAAQSSVDQKEGQAQSPDEGGGGKEGAAQKAEAGSGGKTQGKEKGVQASQEGGSSRLSEAAARAKAAVI